MNNQSLFGTLATGEEVHEIALRNAHGFEAKIITLGAIVRQLLVPTEKMGTVDVVLGFSNLADYEAGHPCFGTVNGRIAGRVTGGTFTIEGVTYDLVKNDPPNHLHGGMNGMEGKVWTIKALSEQSVTLSYVSPDGESGYPGEVTIDVCYTVTEENTLRIEYAATTTKTTPLCLTNHSYFNLNGEGSGLILDHDIQIFANEYAPTDEYMTLLGKKESLDGKPNDFREPTNLGGAIPQIFANHGDNYFFDNPARELKKVALLFSKKSGCTMEVFSDQQSLQFYTSKSLDSTNIGKSGKAYPPFSAVCLECQGYPDGVNTPEIEDILLRPGKKYSQKTEYRFS